MNALLSVIELPEEEDHPSAPGFANDEDEEQEHNTFTNAAFTPLSYHIMPQLICYSFTLK